MLQISDSAPRNELENERNISQVGLSGTDEGSELALILTLDILEGEDGGGLFVNNSTETGLALDNDVGDTHFAAKSRKEDNQFDGVNIVGNNHKRCLLCFNEGNAVVQTVLHEKRLLVLWSIGMNIVFTTSFIGDKPLQVLFPQQQLWREPQGVPSSRPWSPGGTYSGA